MQETGDNVKLYDAYKEFSLRLYRWSLEDFYREIDEGFPLMRTVHGEDAVWFLKTIHSFSYEKKRLLARGLLQNSIDFRYSGDEPNRKAHELAQEWYGHLRTRPLWPVEPEHKKYEVARATAPRIKRLLNAKGGRVDRAYYILTNTFGDWILHTTIDCTNRYAVTVEYSHSLFGRDLPDYPQVNAYGFVDDGSEAAVLYKQLKEIVPFGAFSGISVLSWLGISRTEYSVPLSSDIEPMIASLSLVTKHFVDAVPGLLEGLDIGSP